MQRASAVIDTLQINIRLFIVYLGYGAQPSSLRKHGHLLLE